MLNKKAVLVVSFGTSHHQTCENNIAAIEADIAQAFPGRELRRAFTSGMIIRKLQKRDHLAVDSVAQALQKLVDEGFSQVLVQPTHVINGEEYDDLAADCQAYRGRIDLLLGAPLLTTAADYAALVSALRDAYPPEEGTAYCLMGHGTTHFADSAYAALDYHFKNVGRPDVFVGTVEGFPDLDTLRGRIAAFAPDRVVLLPLMVVAGDHAVNDMAGDKETSWKSVLEQDGYLVNCVLRGLGEYPAVRNIYLEHARACVQQQS